MKILKRLAGTRLTLSDVVYLFAKIVMSVVLISSFGWLMGIALVVGINLAVDQAI